MHQGFGQSAPAVLARRRLLADVGSARVDAQTLDVARRAVRHPAPALGQNRRLRGRNEDDDPRASADLVSRAGGLALRPFANAPPRHLRRGGVTPQESNPSRQPANPFTPRSGLSQETARCVRHNDKTKINPPSATHQAARCSRRCIMRASHVLRRGTGRVVEGVVAGATRLILAIKQGWMRWQMLLSYLPLPARYLPRVVRGVSQ